MTGSCWLWVAGKPPSLFICSGCPAVGAGGLLVGDRELVVGHGGDVDECALDGSAASGDVEPDYQCPGCW